MTTPVPDLKPHVPPLPPGSEACGCCDGIAAETPQGLSNRAGLSAIRYRIGDYAQFRASLQAALSSSDFAPLANLRTRDDDDFSIGLIDAFACSADVLTFYQERLANESFLRTATERVSLQELGKLVGYRLRPGVAAETWLAFALDTPPAPPASLAPEPGNFVTGVPAALSLDTGLKVQSVPGPNETPQTFETVEPLPDARPAWNAMRPWMSEMRTPARNDTLTYLAGVRNNLKSGDALLMLGNEFVNNTNRNNWDFRVIDSVELQVDADRTLVRWKRGLGSIVPPMTPAAQSPQVHVLRKRAAGFGHNAPMWGSLSIEFRDNYPAGKGATEWPGFALWPSALPAGTAMVDLDAVYAEVHNGSYVVLAKGGFNSASEPAPANTYVELYAVSNVAEVARAEFALAGRLTRLQLRGDSFETQFRQQLRATVAFVQSEALVFAPYPVDDAVAGALIPVAAAADGLLPGRRLIVRGTRAADGAVVAVQATLVAAHALDAVRCTLEIAPPLADALLRSSVVVHANVALASHGESVSQILGSGDASTAFQRFELKQLPLTWRAAANELGAAPELTVRIGDIAWTARSTLYGAASDARAYALATDEQGRNFVVFGDGVSGARLPSRPNNVRAAYRKGLGVDGNVAPDKLTQLMSRPLGLKSVSNPIAAEGGTDPEAADAARDSIPLTTRTLGRAVSVLDYEDFARAFSGIAKAQAQVLQLRAGPVVALAIAGPEGAALDAAGPVWNNLLAALKASGDPHVAVRLLACQQSTFRLGLKVKRDPAWDIGTVLAAVETALRAHYAFDARALAQPVQQSEVIAVAQAVPGVVAVDITRLYGGTQPASQTLPSVQVRLLASALRVAGGVALPAELLTLDTAPFDQLEEMT
ncbi:baseplate J/gp47 family protein [Variovorax sp. PBL-E5]|uniref:baseplate J/gp47 family protein n=1 Tax=Variovorax sp. PBL-E5 TaxID=434014 RepID=UPI0013197E9D|nr:baseplate J/gp47 family protein [Variovorax sp. PBL-E5]VTU35516.1 baseplate wedge subunit [Variovorax sp. PBL-E5]